MSNQGIRLIGPALGGLIVSVASAGIGFGLDRQRTYYHFIFIIFKRN